MAEKNYRNSLTVKDISSIHKVRYDNPTNFEEFEDVYGHLHAKNKVYYSNVAERRRSFIVKKDLPLSKYYSYDKALDIFTKLIDSYMLNINKELAFKKLNNIQYVNDKNGRVYRIEVTFNKFKNKDLKDLNIPSKITITFIDQDVVYWENFYLIPDMSVFKKLKRVDSLSVYDIKNFRIRYEKIVKTPFVMEPYNLQTKMAKRNMKQNFNITFSQIIKGVKAL